eukprot:3938926-Rhodomonas_salina.2
MRLFGLRCGESKAVWRNLYRVFPCGIAGFRAVCAHFFPSLCLACLAGNAIAWRRGTDGERLGDEQNLAEAEYVVAVYMYMCLLGYPAEKITMLSTYNGQVPLP